MDKRITHGCANTPTYYSWRDMMRRCYDPKNAAYVNYGGRGIAVHESMRDIRGFIGVMGLRSTGMTLDRIDPNGNYTPGNVRWVPRADQNRNTRATDWITFKGKTQPLTVWAREIGITQGTLWCRLYRDGMSIDDALTKPMNRTPGRKLTDEQIVAIREGGESQRRMAIRFGVNKSTITRIRAGTRWRTV